MELTQPGALCALNKKAAARTVQSLAKAPTRLLVNPRLGEQLFEFSLREVRRIIVGQYEMRYELQGECIYIAIMAHP